jgi:hypothetical protein
VGQPDEGVAFLIEVPVRRQDAVGAQLVRQETVQQGEREVSGLSPYFLLTILVDDAVLARLARGARLAEGDLGPGDVLQLDGAMLQDVAEPRALILSKATHEATGLAVGTTVLVKPGQRREEPFDEPFTEPRGRPRFQLAEIDDHPDDAEVSVKTRAQVDAGLPYLHDSYTSLSGPSGGAVARLRSIS